MPERTSYAQGTPSWVDLSSPDVEASAAFYGGLFGWTADGATESPEDTGGYQIFMLRGKRVAGVMPIMSPEQPPAWSTYIAVDDADETAAKAMEAGGQIIVEPMDVRRPAGWRSSSTRPALHRHLAGERAHRRGARQRAGLPGWNDLATRDAVAAKAFYATVFGIEAAPGTVPSDATTRSGTSPVRWSGG